MKNGWAIFGWSSLPLVLICQSVNGVHTFGRQWTWGKYGMPRSVVAANGNTFADGTPINPIAKIIIQQGEEDIYLIMLIGIAALFAMWIQVVRTSVKLRKRQDLSTPALAKAQR